MSAIPIQTIAVYDLVISLLIALALLLVGQAVVSYEIFTGRVLPRRSFVRHWRNAIILAAGYGIIVGWSIALQLRSIYSLLLATILLTLFYALYSWRSFWERDQFMARLRPFVQSGKSQSLPPPNQEIAFDPPRASSAADDLLAALCQNILGTANAQLVPMGSMAPLVATTLYYPVTNSLPLLHLPHDLNEGMTALNAAQFSPYHWAISLWDERGRIGVLLIGEKVDGGLYSQEEMEAAQATGERIVNLLAGEEMVRRLMELQRKRTAEQRVMDLRTRRTLHDEVLPALHLAVLQLNGAAGQPPAGQQAGIQETLRTLAEAHQQISDLLTNAQPTPSRAPEAWELVTALHVLVESEFAHTFEQITWHGLLCNKGAEEVCKGTGERTGIAIRKSPHALQVDPVAGEVIIGAAREVIRNAASHGRGGKANRPIRLQIGLCAGLEKPGPEKPKVQKANEIVLTIADNGVGIDGAQRLAKRGGSGNGLALHSTLLAMVGGYLTVESPPEGGTLVRVTVAR